VPLAPKKFVYQNKKFKFFQKKKIFKKKNSKFYLSKRGVLNKLLNHDLIIIPYRAVSTPSSAAGSDYDADESDNDDLSSEFHHVSLQLLDLMHTLHTRAAQIHFSWAEESEINQVEQQQQEGSESWGSNPCYNLDNTSRLWAKAWCPLLQVI
jgi:hypothetical protein